MGSLTTKAEALCFYWPLITEQAEQLIKKAGHNVPIACEDKDVEEKWGRGLYGRQGKESGKDGSRTPQTSPL